MVNPREAASSGPHPAQLPPDPEPTGSGPGARGPRLASVVVFVHDHDASADFYGVQRCERVLRARSARVDTREAEGFTLIEGRDPSGLPVLVAYPGPDEVARLEIISRYYV